MVGRAQMAPTPDTHRNPCIRFDLLGDIAVRVAYENRFSELEPLLARVEKPTRYINHEWGALYKPEAEHRCAPVSYTHLEIPVRLCT